MTDDADSGTNLGLDPSVANVARVYDYMLGGKDNFSVDRQLGSQLLTAFPEAAWIARQNRAFAGRAVRYCAEHGVGQFLDVGSGLPTMDNVHEVARRVITDAAVVYVDNDKVAHSHAEALLTTNDGVAAITGDVREPGQILADVRAGGLLDLTRPFVTRSRLDIAAMFSGFQLVKPGLVRTSRWQPPEQVTVTEASDLFAGVGRKP
jgi:hypothetical protein